MSDINIAKTENGELNTEYWDGNNGPYTHVALTTEEAESFRASHDVRSPEPAPADPSQVPDVDANPAGDGETPPSA